MSASIHHLSLDSTARPLVWGEARCTERQNSAVPLPGPVRLSPSGHPVPERDGAADPHRRCHRRLTP